MEPLADRSPGTTESSPSESKDLKKPTTARSKRIRPSYSCTLCKSRKKKCDKQRPSCGNCLKINKTCEYPPEVISIKQKLKLLQQTLNKEDDDEESVETADIPLPSRSVLLDQIYKLKMEVESLKKAAREQENNSPEPTETSPPSEKFGTHTVDLLGEYSTLISRANGDEEYKPLSHMAFFKRDVYYSFMCFFLLLHLHIAKALASSGKPSKFQLRPSERSSKYMTLADLNKEPALKKFHDSVVRDRAKLMNFNGFPLFNLNTASTEQLITLVKQSLPPRPLLHDFISFFIENVYPYRPFIDPDDFKSEIGRIITFDHYTSEPRITLSKPSDLATMALLMVLLRYTYVCLRQMKEETLPESYKDIYHHEISIDLINVCQMCLSYYKIHRKMSLTMFQAVLLLRVYDALSPEQQDGKTGVQGQAFVGFLTQSALVLGLHRDPELFDQLKANVKLSNLRRRLWFGLQELETCKDVVNGCIPLTPDYPYSDVRQLTATDNDSEIQSAIIRESASFQPLNRMYVDLIKLFNDTSKSALVTDIVGKLKKAKTYIDKNYSIDDLTPLDSTQDQRLKASISYRNIQILSRNLLQHTASVHIHHFLRIHYESKAHRSKDLCLHFIAQVLVSLRNGFDISLAVLQKSLGKYCLDSTLHHLFQPAFTLLLRCIPLALSSALELYHARSLLQAPEYHKTGGCTVVDIDEIVKLNVYQLKYAIHVLKTTAATKSWVCLKLIVGFNYVLEVIEAHKFGTITDIIEFITSPVQEQDFIPKDKESIVKALLKEKLSKELSVSALVKEWVKVKVSGPTPNSYVYENTRNFNIYADCTKSELLGLMELAHKVQLKLSSSVPMSIPEFDDYFKANNVPFKNGVSGMPIATNPRPFFTHGTTSAAAHKNVGRSQRPSLISTHGTHYGHQSMSPSSHSDQSQQENPASITNIEFSLSDTLNGNFSAPVWNFNFGNTFEQIPIGQSSYATQGNVPSHGQTRGGGGGGGGGDSEIGSDHGNFFNSTQAGISCFGNLEEILQQFQDEYPS